MEPGGGMVLGYSHVSETTRVRFLAPTKFLNSIFNTRTLYRIKTKSNTLMCYKIDIRLSFPKNATFVFYTKLANETYVIGHQSIKKGNFSTAPSFASADAIAL